MFANIIVDITHEKLDKIFQYRVPSRLAGELSVGMEVLFLSANGTGRRKDTSLVFRKPVIMICQK